MITYFSEKQLQFSEAVLQIAREVEERPETRRLLSPFILAVVDCFLEHKKKKAICSDDS